MTTYSTEYNKCMEEMYDNIEEFDQKHLPEFNKIIKNHILKKENFKNHGQSGHYSEQYKYIDKNYNIHIIKFENIKEEFNNLMKKYSLDIELEEHENKGKKLFTVNSLSKDVIKLINTIYDKDFESFGYKKISSN